MKVGDKITLSDEGISLGHWPEFGVREIESVTNMYDPRELAIFTTTPVPRVAAGFIGNVQNCFWARHVKLAGGPW